MVSRDKVQVALRISTSTAPDFRASKRLAASERHEFHLRAIGKYSSCDRAAVIDLQPGPFSVGIWEREAAEADIHAADELPPRLHLIERLCVGAVRGRKGEPRE